MAAWTHALLGRPVLDRIRCLIPTLFQPGELTGIDVYLVGRPEDHEPHYGAEVQVHHRAHDW